jgi:exopolysaccharide production protein ExoQ
MPRSTRTPAQIASRRNRTAFWVSAGSVMLLLTTVRYGTIAAAGFVGLWGWYFLAWPKIAADALLRTRLPWTFPLFALLSAMWSSAPDVTMRNAAEWLGTAGIGVLMASTLPMERLLASWMVAIVPVVLIGGLIGGSQFTETGEVAAIGIFGSKNNFALHISEMLLICVAVLGNRQQPRLLRLMALGGGLIAPLLLWRAKSVGALVVFLPSLVLLSTVILLGRMRPHLRQIAVAGCIVLGVAFTAVVAPVATTSKDAMLNAVGKSEDLTGRGLLWQRAAILVQQRPTFGVGYGAFWLQGNPEAEALWRAEHIPSRGGFHFHNFYYETLVELGYSGLVVGLATFGLICAAVLVFGVRHPGPESGFFCAIMLFLCLRSFVELDLLGGFGLATLILPAAWVYATSPTPAGGHAAYRRWTAHPAASRSHLYRGNAA